MIVDRKKFLMCVSVALSLILYIYILIKLCYDKERLGKNGRKIGVWRSWDKGD